MTRKEKEGLRGNGSGMVGTRFSVDVNNERGNGNFLCAADIQTVTNYHHPLSGSLSVLRYAPDNKREYDRRAAPINHLGVENDTA